MRNSAPDLEFVIDSGVRHLSLSIHVQRLFLFYDFDGSSRSEH